MKYDDSSWHYGGEFPGDLPMEAGATHAGMYLAWALLNGLGGDLFASEEPEIVAELQTKSITPGKFFLKYCDGKLTDDDLSEVGNQFTEVYFDFEKGRFVEDYEEVLAESLESLYHVPDTWESFDRLRPVIDKRFAAWQGGDG